MDKNIIKARPCKEKPNEWEIVDQNGVVREKHYKTKDECVEAARELCVKCGCNLDVLENRE